jgi:hypothetical protein
VNVRVYNLMAYNHQFFRPQPVVKPKQDRFDKKKQSFQDVLNEKMSAYKRISEQSNLNNE